ncbi:MAG: WbuC family cupin fold metalloprotein [Xanthobacteraceae bacterium]
MTPIDRPQHIDEGQLQRLLAEAAASTRRRSHLLLHEDHQDQVQRLLIGLEPDSYVRPHVHSEQWEMLVLLRGRLDVLIFTPEAALEQRLAMSPTAPVVQIPRGTWHGAVARCASLVMEIKPGPYRANEFAAWAPAEGEAGAAAFVRWAGAAKSGNTWSAASF